MESFKHSCPYCGQHVDYTAGYCGRQIQCPICGNTITFPALPPKGGAQALRVNQKPARKWAWVPHGLFLFLRDFPHWKTVAQCVVPFLIVGALLAGAAYVKTKFIESPAPPEEPIVQADPGAWQKMTDLTRAEQAVRQQINVVEQARVWAATTERSRTLAHRQFPGNSNPFAVKSADETAQKAQSDYNKARERFSVLLREYQQLGGTKDYHPLN
ncbi:MAG: hypothetical protein ABSH38_03920 [Verrucomicrobiota bacterium]|jgi:hypothetical protein